MEADKALLLDDLENMQKELEEIKKEVTAHGDDASGLSKKDAGNGNEKGTK